MGALRGDLTVLERVDIGGTATVVGMLTAPRVRMAPGASFQGRVDMPSGPTDDRDSSTRVPETTGRAAARTRTRRYPRVMLGIDTPLATEVTGEHGRSDGLMTVISAGGACVELSGTFPVDSVVRLSFRLPESGQVITCRGHVRDDVPGYGIGVEFTGLDASDRTLIRDAVRTWLAKERDASSEPEAAE